MYNITLVCTRHKEIGACNSTELLKIIEEYQPEVIFEELAPSIYAACYEYNCWGLTSMTTLETDAIKVYRQYHDVKHIPALSTTEMLNDLHSMQRMVANRSLDVLADNLISLMGIYGFPFLNSDEGEQQADKLKALEKSTLNNDEIFSRAWQGVDNYEYDMLQNIYQYSAENHFNQALMFIGAAHRKTITKKIKEYRSKHPLKLNWSFYNNQPG